MLIKLFCVSWTLDFDIVVQVLLATFLPFLHSLFYFNIVELVEDLVVVLRLKVAGIVCRVRVEILKCFVVLRIILLTKACL